MTVSRDVRDIWSTSKIGQHMFTKYDRSSLTFNKFFAPDVVYTLEQVLAQRIHPVRNYRALQRTVDLIYQNTWMRSVKQEHPDVLDFSQLDQLNVDLLPKQWEFLKTYNEMTAKYGLAGYLLGAVPGSGKAQPLDALIKVPGGWSTMGEMKVGMEVITPTGKTTKVTGVYPQGKKKIYRLTFSDGRTVEACEEHLWKVHLRNDQKEGYWSIRTTKQIMESNSFKTGRAYIPLIESENGEEKELPIDPYLFGVLLGDGHLRADAIRISHPDIFIKEKVRNRLPEGVKIGDLNSEVDYTLVGSRRDPDGRYRNPLVRQLKTLALAGTHSHTKFIPDVYLDGSRQQRIDLLNGLMDTDGYADRQGTASFCTTSLDMANKVVYLVRSLGGMAYISEKNKFFTYKGEKKLGRTAFQVNIRHKRPEELFSLPRKKERVSNSNQYAEHLKLRIERIEYVGSKDAQCISVEDQEHLYVTNGFVVTHNTIGCLAVSLCAKADVTIAIVPKNAVIDVWEATLNKRFKKPPQYWHSLSGEALKSGKKYYIFHYEQLDRAVAFAQQLFSQRMTLNPCVLLDESHNLNEMDSTRSKLFVEMCRVLSPKHIVWSSGTPLKALGKEVVPLLKTIDRLFDADAEERFLAIFGKNAARANDILRNRMGLLTFQVDKKDVVDNKTQTFEQKVVLPNGRDYTLDTIREEMRSFILQRMAYYEEHMDLFIEVYMDALKLFETTLHSEDSRKQYRTYRSYVDAIRAGYDPVTMKDMVVFCNKYEKGVIAPTLPRDLKHQFLDARSVVKYYELKVQGEALGRVLGRKRAQCHVDMVPHMGLPELIDASLSKTIIFTSYVTVVKAMDVYLRGEGYEPLMVYGETNHDLPAIMERFKRQERADPLLATYDSLSTAVPVVEASTAILTNAPFRDYEYEQATSRIDRLDQQYPCTIWNVYLDTGHLPNISTRSKDIMQWSREQVEQIMGKKSMDPSIAIEEFRDLAGFCPRELRGKPRYLSW